MLIKNETPPASDVIAPYSEAIDTGNMLFISGQLGFDAASGELPECFETQAKNVMNKLKTILEKNGYSFEQVVKTTIFLNDMANYAKTNEIYSAFFPSRKPARSCVQVAALPLGGKIEIELIAIRG